MRTFCFLHARTVGAGLVLALAVCYGCVAPGAVTIPTRAEIRADLRAELSSEFSAFKTEVGAKIGDITAQRVDASTTNFDRKALYLLILCCFSPLKSVWRVVKEWRDTRKSKRNGGAK